MIGEIIGSVLNLATPWLEAMYNSPKRQARRLQKAGFSKNALFKMQNLGNVGRTAPVNFSSDFGIHDAQKRKAEAEILGVEADYLTQPRDGMTFEVIDATGRALGDMHVPGGNPYEVEQNLTRAQAAQNIQTSQADLLKMTQSRMFTKKQREALEEKLPQIRALSEAELSQAETKAKMMIEQLETYENVKSAVNRIFEAARGEDGELSVTQAALILAISRLVNLTNMD